MKDTLFKDYYSYANFYDIFTKYRNINIEGKYILEMIKNRKRVLDVGCGTGNHINILENLGYEVVGIDKSKKMVEISKFKNKSKVYEMDVLDFNLNETFDAIICMKSVLNHLLSYEEFEQAIDNMLKILEKNGMIIIDLDNKKIKGEYCDKVDGNKRIIISNYDEINEIQTRNFVFYIGTKKFEFIHKYKIFNTLKIKKILDKKNIKYVFLTNYSKQEFNNKNERLQIIIRKN